MSITRLGPIKAVTYTCGLPTKRGLCRTDRTSAYRHEWQIHKPMLAKDDKGRFHILCNIQFADGPDKVGIDDLPEGERQSCSLQITKPNPGDLDVVGELQFIEIDGKKRPDYKFTGSVLCVSKDGSRLHIVDKADVKGLSATSNPDRALESVINPAPALDITDPNLREMVAYNSRGMLSNLLACEEHARESGDVNSQSSWCFKKHLLLARDHHGAELVEHLSSAGKAQLAAEAKKICDTLDGCLKSGKADVGQIREVRNNFRRLFMPDTVCGQQGVCAHDVSSSHSHSSDPGLPRQGVRMWGSRSCVHCQRTKAAAAAAGITIHYIETTEGEGKRLADQRGIRAVPLLEIVHDGRVVKEHAGELTAEQLKKWAA